MKRLPQGILTGYFIVLLLSTNLVQAGELDYPVTRLTDKVHVIYGPYELPNEKNEGFRNNVVIVQTSKGAVVFDPGGSASAGEMVVRKVKTLTSKPIIAVFNSHAHGDHWLGNEAIKRHYPAATIYCHKNARTKINGSNGLFWLETINKITKGKAKGKKVAAPDKTVNNGNVISVGDTRFRIFHKNKAHTDNDIMIEIVGTNTIFTGDVIRNGLLGIMEEDASFEGNIATIDFLLDRKFRTIIPGHGPAGGKEIARVYRGYLQTILGQVKHYYSEGLADFEMKGKILPKVSSYKHWAGFEMRVGSHISRAYLEVENEAF